MLATDAFIWPKPLHQIPTPQSASQNVFKIADQFQYPPCVLRASQKHTYRSLSVGSVGWRKFNQARIEYNVSTKVLVPLCIAQGAKGPAQQREIWSQKWFQFWITFWRQCKYRQEGREAKTEAKNSFEKASPIPAAMDHRTWRFHTIRRWVFTSVPTEVHYPQQHRGCNSQPKFSPSLRDIKTSDCRVRTGGGHELVCAFMTLLRSCFLLLHLLLCKAQPVLWRRRILTKSFDAHCIRSLA